jgi:hypothetical protein
MAEARSYSWYLGRLSSAKCFISSSTCHSLQFGSRCDSKEHHAEECSTLILFLPVEIGGGIPSKQNNIRLGEIVVSRPTDQGGVIQVGLGKETKEGAQPRGPCWELHVARFGSLSLR